MCGTITSPGMEELRWGTFIWDVLVVLHGSGCTGMADAITGVFEQHQGGSLDGFWGGVWSPILRNINTYNL